MRKLAVIAAILLSVVAAHPAFAVQPDEVLANPVLEGRARALSGELRCMVCQNQSIDDSDADLARDLRVLVRERLTAGDTDEQVLDFIVSRYGEFVLLKPRFSAHTAILWGAPVVLLIGGALLAVFTVRSRRKQTEELSQEEQERLAKILDEPRG